MFLDMDLSILGAPDAVYREYSKAIKSEYAWVPEFMYRRERRRILAGFLARATVYLTEVMRNRFEMQARINLDQELQALSAGAIH